MRFRPLGAGTFFGRGLNVLMLQVAAMMEGTCLFACRCGLVSVLWGVRVDWTNTKEDHEGDAAAKPDCVWPDNNEAKVSLVHRGEERGVCDAGHVHGQRKQVHHNQHDKKLSSQQERAVVGCTRQDR